MRRIDLGGQRISLAAEPVYRRLFRANQVDQPRGIAAADLAAPDTPWVAASSRPASIHTSGTANRHGERVWPGLVIGFPFPARRVR